MSFLPPIGAVTEYVESKTQKTGKRKREKKENAGSLPKPSEVRTSLPDAKVSSKSISSSSSPSQRSPLPVFGEPTISTTSENINFAGQKRESFALGLPKLVVEPDANSEDPFSKQIAAFLKVQPKLRSTAEHICQEVSRLRAKMCLEARQDGKSKYAAFDHMGESSYALQFNADNSVFVHLTDVKYGYTWYGGRVEGCIDFDSSIEYSCSVLTTSNTAAIRGYEVTKGLKGFSQLLYVVAYGNETRVITSFGRQGNLLDLLPELTTNANKARRNHITRQLIEALAALHKKKHLFRNINLVNITLNSSDEVLILDPEAIRNLRSLQMDFATSPTYASPELLEAGLKPKGLHIRQHFLNLVSSTKADVFSLGVALSVLHENVVPSWWLDQSFYADSVRLTDLQEVQRIMENELPLMLEESKKTYSGDKGMLAILSMMDPDPEKRPLLAEIVKNLDVLFPIK
jgi:hypothetical protein